MTKNYQLGDLNGRKDTVLFLIASQIGDVIHYIQNQETHHRQKSFLEEYKELFHAFEIPFEDKYLFHQPD